MKRRIGFALCAAVIVAVAIIMWPRTKQFLDVDACLDSGGRYDYALSACEYGEEGA